MTYNYVATCLFGLEHLLGEEIDALGYKRRETIDGRVFFTGDENAAARCNIWLRYAERLYIEVGSCAAESFSDLFDGVAAMPWENYIGYDDKFPVRGHSIKSKLFSVPDCQRIIKKSIANRLLAAHRTDILPETGILFQVDFFIFRDRAYLMIDTSGTPLHKRGYRPASVSAPLRETLAASLAKLSRPREEVLFWDPFCGSGTIAIEAAMIMKNIAPGANRHFSAEVFPFIPESAWRLAREEAKDSVKNTKFEAYASDIDPSSIEIASENVRRAGVGDIVRTFVRDALTIETGGRRGTIVTNPPYGERISTISEVEELYRRMGEHFKTLDRWQIYILTSHENFERLYGARADKVRKLYNGMIPCYFYQYFKQKKQ